jgi:polar amino acid transport system substrate-binding protein
VNKFQIFISFAVLSFMVLPAQSSTEIKIGLTGFKPYSDYNQETGECVGVAIDFTQELLQPYGLEVSATCASPARIYRSISRGLVDISLNIK